MHIPASTNSVATDEKLLIRKDLIFKSISLRKSPGKPFSEYIILFIEPKIIALDQIALLEAC